MKKYIVPILLFSLMLFSCGAKRHLLRQVTVFDTYPATPGQLEVYQAAQQLPSNRIQIGMIVVGDAGFTKTEECTYQACMKAIQEEGKVMGGEFVHIVSIVEPDMNNTTCYKIIADVYRYKKKTTTKKK